MGISSKKQTTKSQSTGSQTSQNQSTATTVNEVPDWYRNPATQIAGNVQGLLNGGYQQFAPQISGLQNQAFQGASNLGLSPYYGNAADALRGVKDISAGQVGAERVGADQVGSRDVSADQIGAERIGYDQVGSRDIGSRDVSAQSVGYNPYDAATYEAQSLLTGLDQYYNPFKDQVLNPVLNDFDFESGKTRAAQAAGAAKGKAFQGSRYGVREAATEGELARGRAATEGGLLGNMYSEATQLSNLDTGRRQQAAAENAAAINAARAQNAQGGLQAGMANQSAFLSADQGNQQAALEAARANQSSALDAAKANQNTGLLSSQANQQAALEAARANQSANLSAGQGNQQSALEAARANQGANLSAAQGNQNTALEAARANQNANLTADQANQNAGFQRASGWQGLGQTMGADQRSNVALQGDLGAQQTQMENLMRQYPIEFQRQMAGLLSGLNPELFTNRTVNTSGTSSGTSTESGTSTQTQNPGLLGGLGQAAQIAALFMSDRTLKRGIRTLFRDWKGRRWVEFAYRWAPNVRRIGVIAQEVLRTDPAAVVRMPGGVLAVDYGRLD